MTTDESSAADPRGTVVLMCGPPGAGKTTYALGLVRRGYVRLSIDEVVWRVLGGQDAGLALEPERYDRLKDQVRREQRQELVELMRAGQNVVMDYSFWSRASRDEYKVLAESHGYRWELIHLKADRATLERRLAVRNRQDGANAVTVDADLLNRYLAGFEEPDGEGEQVRIQVQTLDDRAADDRAADDWAGSARAVHQVESDVAG